MENCNCMGVIAVVAITGGVTLLSLQFQRRLSSDFFKKLRAEIASSVNAQGGERGVLPGKKKVRFAPDVIEPSANNEEYRRRIVSAVLARRTGRSITGVGR